MALQLNANGSWRFNETQIEESICTVAANSIEKNRNENQIEFTSKGLEFLRGISSGTRISVIL